MENTASTGQRNEVVIELRGVSTRYGERVVHENLDLDVRRAEIFALVGGSGSGKSTLLREMILLQRPPCACWGSISDRSTSGNSMRY